MKLSYFKLSSGEEMIAQVEDTGDNYIRITKPVMILIMPGVDRDSIGVNLVGFVPTLALWDNTFDLYRQNIVMATTLGLTDPLRGKYEKLLEVYSTLPRTFKSDTPELLVEDDIESTPSRRYN